MIYQFTNRWLTMWLIFTLTIALIPTYGIHQSTIVAQANTKPTIQIGDYIRFGKYNNEPILWRVIHLDQSGDPLLFADRILAIKGFDAGGCTGFDGDECNTETKLQNGRNFYSDSNIRQWLNSASPNSGSDVINWNGIPPLAAKMLEGKNGYATEKGFLADGNFTSGERSLIKPVTQKVMVSGDDVAARDGGSVIHGYSYSEDREISAAMRNYDTTALFQNVSDSVFLPSLKQLKEYVVDQATILGSNELFAKPTAAAVANSSYKNTQTLNTTSNYKYWLNTPNASAGTSVLYINDSGKVMDHFAYDDTVGIRPALQMNLASALFASVGSGRSDDPYIVAGSVSSPNQPIPTVTPPSYLGAFQVNNSALTLTWRPSVSTAGIRSYELYQGSTLFATIGINDSGAPATSFRVTGLTPGTTYTFSVRGRDKNNQVSEPATLDITTSGFKVGEYIQFGHYNNEPILWRIIHKDYQGNLMLLSDRILALKAFDTAGSYHAGNAERLENGSNYYPDSNLRQWLNSKKPNVGADPIDWIQNDPNAKNVWDQMNPYSTEKGFLAAGNFTEAERSLIEPFTHKVLVSGVDAANKSGGSAAHVFDSNIATSIQNYDKGTYFRNVTDEVFLLSVKQLKQHVYDNRNVLGNTYHTAKPTRAALENGGYANSANLNLTNVTVNTNFEYWLNTPFSMNNVATDVRTVRANGDVQYDVAGYAPRGVRPALLMNVANAIISSGKGTSTQPFVIRDAFPRPADSQPPTVPSGLKASNVTVGGFTVSWTPSTDNVAVTAYEIYLNNEIVFVTQDTSFIFTGLTEYTRYSVTVRAKDLSKNFSPMSQGLTLRTADKTPPTTPGKLKFGNITATDLSLSWAPASDNAGVTGYEVYRNGKLAGTTQTTNFKARNLNEHTVQTFTIRAVDAGGNKSKSSVSLKTEPTVKLVGNQIYVNFKAVNLGPGVSIVQLQGRTMVPCKPIFVAMGLNASYNTATKTFSATRTGFKIDLTQGNANALINGKRKVMPIAPTVVKGTLMMPLSFVAAELGYKVTVIK